MTQLVAGNQQMKANLHMSQTLPNLTKYCEIFFFFRFEFEGIAMKNLFSKILFVGRTSLFFFRNLKLFLYLYLYWDLHFYNHCNVSSWSGEQLVLWLILIGSSSPSAAPSQKSGHRPTFGPICPTITNNPPKSSQSSHQPQHIFWR